MPKIIPNLETTIIESAKAQIMQNGYRNLTIRALAADCNIALGTVYNYFSSKSELQNAVIEHDWETMLDDCKKRAPLCSSVDDAMIMIYANLKNIYTMNQNIFSDPVSRKIYLDLEDSHREYCVLSLSEVIIDILKMFEVEADHDIVEMMSLTLMSSIKYKEVSTEVIRNFTERLVLAAV